MQTRAHVTFIEGGNFHARSRLLPPCLKPEGNDVLHVKQAYR